MISSQLKTKKTISAVLSIVMILSLCATLSTSSMANEEADENIDTPSMPGIEKLKSSQGGAFKILEIVPDENEGSIGYYIDSYEPCANWAEEVAFKSTPEERVNYINGDNGLYEELTSKGLLGSNNTTPLEFDGKYSEVFPWQEHSTYKKLTLNHDEEKSNVKGKITVANVNGNYEQIGIYSIPNNPDERTHIQIINQLEYNTTGTNEDKTDNVFWYHPTFVEIPAFTSSGEEPVTDGDIIYKNTSTFDDPLDTPSSSDVEFEYVGTVGEEDFDGLEIGKVYYRAIEGEPKSTYKAPSSGESMTVSQDSKENNTYTPPGYTYAAISDGFRIAKNDETPYFREDVCKYRYLDKGDGNYNFTPDEKGKDTTLVYNTVFYKGGFLNNNWFLRYVFDCTDEEIDTLKLSLVLDTKAAKDVTVEDFSGVNMVVVGKSFSIYNNAGNFSAKNDISTDVLAKLLEFANLGNPFVLDSSLKSIENASNISNLASELLNGKEGNGVRGNIYFHKDLLATKDFANKEISGNFDDVSAEIVHQNNLRNLNSTPDRPIPSLNGKISQAKVIRHIIHKSVMKSAGAKYNLKILDLEPGDHEPSLSVESGSQVLDWLNIPETEKKNYSVNIVTQPTSEFIGKIENISEIYDMIYVGSNVSDFNKRDYYRIDITDYNDDNMDGLVYSNIGDTVQSGGDSGWNMSGLLDRDYSEDTFYHDGIKNSLNTGTYLNPNQTTRTFRYSGNDITQKKLNELVQFANTGYPIIFADDLITGTKITGSATQGDGQYKTKIGDSIRHAYYSATIKYDNDDLHVVAGYDQTKWVDNKIDTGNVTKVNYQWLKGENPISDATKNTFNVEGENNSSYKCEVTATEVKDYGIDNYGYMYNVQPSFTETVTFYNRINELKVDSSSKMFEFMDNVIDKENVMSVSNIDSEKLKIYTNLSKPEIQFSEKNGYPTEYSIDNEGNITSLSDRNLNYNFTIRNYSDPTPQSTDYNCKVYVDENGDGLYDSDHEILTDLTVRNKDNERINSNSMKANVPYTLSCHLPNDVHGIVPWKLVITSNQDEKIHTSAHKYTHVIVKTVPTINILQIMPSDGCGLNLAENGTYQDLFHRVESEFLINVQTIEADELDSKDNYINKIEAKDSPKKFKKIGSFLKSFDMLIMGFDDSYKGLSLQSSKAIVDFISSGKATLFSHDCTSFFFLPFKEYETPNEEGGGFLEWIEDIAKTPDFVYKRGNTTWSNEFSMFGYNFNMTIRDAVGLDRYGVTNPDYGVSQYAPKQFRGNDWKGWVAAGYPNKDKLDKISENYSIAYKPNSAKNDTVGETQGLSKGVLTRFYKDESIWDNILNAITGGNIPLSSTSPQMIDKITQVNEGQITTYPFNVNTDKFNPKLKSNTNTKNIALTHSQYDQLNMNSNDIVVWYCLKDIDAVDNYMEMDNDVINDYYIYSRKNVTYTGMGHTTSKVNEYESKLFVNTMIAAYRLGTPDPEVYFSDELGKDLTVDSLLIPTDDNDKYDDYEYLEEVTDADGSKLIADSQKIFFTVHDTAIGDKNLDVKFYDYATTDSIKDFDISNFDPIPKLKIYDAETNELIKSEETHKTLISGNTYYITIENLISQNANAQNDGFKLHMWISRTVDTKTVRCEAPNALTLRKLSLFDLS